MKKDFWIITFLHFSKTAMILLKTFGTRIGIEKQQKSKFINIVSEQLGRI